jgi:hypothetical protein
MTLRGGLSEWTYGPWWTSLAPRNSTLGPPQVHSSRSLSPPKSTPGGLTAAKSTPPPLFRGWTRTTGGLQPVDLRSAATGPFLGALFTPHQPAASPQRDPRGVTGDALSVVAVAPDGPRRDHSRDQPALTGTSLPRPPAATPPLAAGQVVPSPPSGEIPHGLRMPQLWRPDRRPPATTGRQVCPLPPPRRRTPRRRPRTTAAVLTRTDR